MNKPDQEFKPFQFGNLQVQADPSREFKMMNLDNKLNSPEHQRVIRNEREKATEQQFRIDKIVSELRGLTKQEQDDLEKKINTQVQSKLNQLKEEAYQQGLNEGKKIGSSQAYDEAILIHQQQIEDFKVMIENSKNQLDNILFQSKNDAYLVLKRFGNSATKSSYPQSESRYYQNDAGSG
jgi:flagellar biosynthesis/type III secretory pathway protein FliH